MSLDYRAVAQMFVDAEIRARGGLRTTTAIHLDKWLKGGFVDPELIFSETAIKSLCHPALYVECYNAMKADLQSKSRPQRIDAAMSSKPSLAIHPIIFVDPTKGKKVFHYDGSTSKIVKDIYYNDHRVGIIWLMEGTGVIPENYNAWWNLRTGRVGTADMHVGSLEHPSLRAAINSATQLIHREIRNHLDLIKPRT